MRLWCCTMSCGSYVASIGIIASSHCLPARYQDLGFPLHITLLPPHNLSGGCLSSQQLCTEETSPFVPKWETEAQPHVNCLLMNAMASA